MRRSEATTPARAGSGPARWRGARAPAAYYAPDGIHATWLVVACAGLTKPYARRSSNQPARWEWSG